MATKKGSKKTASKGKSSGGGGVAKAIKGGRDKKFTIDDPSGKGGTGGAGGSGKKGGGKSSKKGGKKGPNG